MSDVIGSGSAGRILVLGVGSAGGEVVNHLAMLRTPGVDLGVVHAEDDFLANALPGLRIKIGDGPGLERPQAAAAAGAAASSTLLPALRRFDFVTAVAGLGEPLAGGAAPEIIRQARSVGALALALAVPPLPSDPGREAAGADLKTLLAIADALAFVDPAFYLSGLRQPAAASEIRAALEHGAADLAASLVTPFAAGGSSGFGVADARRLLADAGALGIAMAEGGGEGAGGWTVERLCDGLRKMPRPARQARGVLVALASGKLSPAVQPALRTALAGQFGIELPVLWSLRQDPALGGHLRVYAVVSYGGERPRWSSTALDSETRGARPPESVDTTIGALAQILVEQGRKLLVEGDFGGAERQLAKALAMQPGVAGAAAALAEARFSAWALRVKTGLERADLGLLANLFAETRRPEWKAPPLARTAASLLNAYAVLQARAGKLEEARKHLAEAAALAPEREEIRRNLARIEAATR